MHIGAASCAQNKFKIRARLQRDARLCVVLQIFDQLTFFALPNRAKSGVYVILVNPLEREFAYDHSGNLL